MTRCYQTDPKSCDKDLVKLQKKGYEIISVLPALSYPGSIIIIYREPDIEDILRT